MAALRCVQGNITPFGGDFNSVTIFGESSGASIVSALVSHPREGTSNGVSCGTRPLRSSALLTAICPPHCPQVLSPLAAGLFHRAIAQSGIITLPGFLDPDPWLLAQVCISFTLSPHVHLPYACTWSPRVEVLPLASSLLAERDTIG